MLTLDRDEVARHLPYETLIAALRTGLLAEIATPPRAHHLVGGEADLLLMMPSWRAGDRIGVKLTSVFPGNGTHHLPMIHALYTLIDGQNRRAARRDERHRADLAPYRCPCRARHRYFG